MIDGIYTRVIQMVGDVMVDLDRNYGLPPLWVYPPTFPTMAASVLLPLKYPLYAPEVRARRPPSAKGESYILNPKVTSHLHG
jgi:hypothetical protein